MTTTIEHPTLVWDTYEIIKTQVEFLQDEEGLDENVAFNQACGDSNFMSFEWECLLDSLTELLQKINPNNQPWRAEVSNFGWQERNGFGTFDADNGKDFLRNILPKTDCSFKIYIDEKEGKISINNTHHDSPTWKEWYHVTVNDESKKVT